jgi:hypothetical protein
MQICLSLLLKCQVNHVILIPIPKSDSKPLKVYWNVRIIGRMSLALYEQILVMFALSLPLFWFAFHPLCYSVFLALFLLILPCVTNHFISCFIFIISIHTSSSSPPYFLHFKFQFHAKIRM